MKRREVITIVVAVLVVGLLFVALKLSGGGNPKSASENPTASIESAEPSGDTPKSMSDADVERLLKEAVDLGSLEERDGGGLKTVYYQNNEPYSGWGKDRYDSGQVRWLGRFEEGKIDGLIMTWYGNGQKEGETTFKDGKADGPWTMWHENGQKQEEATYKDGKIDGSQKEWEKYTLTMYERTFKDGELIYEKSWPAKSWNAKDERVEMDKRVQVPIARYSEKQRDMMGRIVINVYSDEHAGEGRFRMADGKGVFVDDGDMVDFIKKQKEEWDTKAQKARLYLRADRKVHFTYVRRAIRAAAAAGINEVIFASRWSGKVNRDTYAVERDNHVSLEARPDIPAVQPFLIKVSSDGHIFANVDPKKGVDSVQGAAEELLDTEVQGVRRDLPRLDPYLECYAANAKASNERMDVQVYVEEDAEQQIVSDVLNVLARHSIHFVTFTDLVAQDEQSK